MSIINLLTISISLLSLLSTYIIFTTNNKPKIIAYTEMHGDKRTIINLVIKNVGKEIAYDVMFVSDKPVPRSAFGLEKLNHEKEFFETGIFIHGVKVFNPEQAFIFEWGQFAGLMEALEEKPIEIKAIYKYKNPLKLWQSKILDISIIDIREMAGLPVNFGSVRVELKGMSDEMVKIRRAIEKINQ